MKKTVKKTHIKLEEENNLLKCNNATWKTDLAGANMHPSRRQNPRAEKEQIQSRFSADSAFGEGRSVWGKEQFVSS